MAGGVVGSIDKRGNGWRFRWQRLDGRRATRQCPDRRTAEALQLEVSQCLALGREWAPAVAPAELRLDDVAAAFLRHVGRTKRASTVANYEAALGRFLDYVGLEAGASVLCRATIEAWYEHLLTAPGRRGGPIDETTRQLYVRELCRCWAWAYDREEYDGRIVRPRGVELPAIAGRPTVAPTWAECDACITALAWRPPQGRPSVVAYRVAVLLRYTGLRAAQALALTPSDVDLEAATVVVRGELGKSRQERRGRIVPLSPWAVEAIRSWGVEAGPLVGAETSPASTTATLRLAWMRSGVREEAWRGRPEHAFRKAFVTELRRRGADVDAVEYLVGHSTGLRGIYVDPDALPLRATVAMVSPIGS